MKLVDISIVSCRERGEHRRSTFSFNGKKGVLEIPEKFNPFSLAVGLNKASGRIFRKASGDFEVKGKPRYYPDWFE